MTAPTKKTGMVISRTNRPTMMKRNPGERSIGMSSHFMFRCPRLHRRLCRRPRPGCADFVQVGKRPLPQKCSCIYGPDMSRTPQNLSAWQVLSRAHRRLQGHLEFALKAEGLPPLDVLDALAALDAGQDGQTAKSLEISLMLPQYGVSRLLDRMEKDGLIRRVADSGDKRLKHVHLTEAGRA